MKSHLKYITLFQVSLLSISCIAILVLYNQIRPSIISMNAAKEKHNSLRDSLSRLESELNNKNRLLDKLASKVNNFRNLEITPHANFRVIDAEKELYLFSIWVSSDPDVMEEIESVHYVFNHGSFEIKGRTGTDLSDGFKVSYQGWGCLTLVEIIIRYKNNAEEDLFFNMCESIGWE